MMSKKIEIIWVLIFVGLQAFGIDDDARYKRKIEDVREGWQRIILPADLYQNTRVDLGDLRIIGVTAENDTVEAPYILRYEQETVREIQAESKIINRSRQGSTYFFTFQLPSGDLVNRIWLEFSQQNFDWLVNLEGSNDQKEWFEILENYRIVSIKSGLADYTFSTLSFPNSSYSYYRLRVETTEKPVLEHARILRTEINEGYREDVDIEEMHVEQEGKNTILNLKLERLFPVSNLRIEVADEYDYYRRLSIEYLADSFHTEKGWKYRYQPLYRGTVSSLEENVFRFDKTLVKDLRVTISNQDNAPLNIEKCDAWGYRHSLIARFVQEADYYLVYGDPETTNPNYDIHHFADRIPDELPLLTLLDEEKIPIKGAIDQKEFFIPKQVLWVLLILIIVTVGYFAMRMLRADHK